MKLAPIDDGVQCGADAELTPKSRGRCWSTSVVLCLSLIALTLAASGNRAVAAGAAIDSSVIASQSIALPSGDGQYFYVGSTAGGQPMESLSWLAGQDLAVTAAYSGNQAISIGRSSSNSGSFSSATGNYAIAGAGFSGYAVVQTFSAQVSKLGPGTSGGNEKAAKGTAVTLPFTTTQTNELVLIGVGGQGTGTLALSGVEATTLQNATYSEGGSHVIASAAIYSAQLPVGKHKARWHSTTYLTNAGQSLGAVAYVLAPLPPPTVTADQPDQRAGHRWHHRHDHGHKLPRCLGCQVRRHQRPKLQGQLTHLARSGLAGWLRHGRRDRHYARRDVNDTLGGPVRLRTTARGQRL